MTPPAAANPGMSAPWPASPAAAAILNSQGAASEVLTPSARTPLTAADLNRWTLVTYAVDPGAPATLHGDQLIKYGMAQQVVRTETDLTSYFGAQKVTHLDQSWAEHTARFLYNPFVRCTCMIAAGVGPTKHIMKSSRASSSSGASSSSNSVS